MCYLGTTGHERTPWGCYCHWVTHVWGFGTLHPMQILGICWNCLNSPYLPPLAIVEALQDNVSHWCKIRRLHLIVVDTWSPWQYNTAQVRAVTDLMKHLADTPDMRRRCCKAVVFLPDAVGLRTGMPLITQNFLVTCFGPAGCKGSIGLSIPWHKAPLSCPQTYFRLLGLHHFYEAFSIEGKANLRQDALAQFGLIEAELTSDLRLIAAAVLRMQWSQHKEQPKAPPARTARR